MIIWGERMTYLFVEETRLALTLSLLTPVEIPGTVGRDDISRYHVLWAERGLEPPLHSIDKRLKAEAAGDCETRKKVLEKEKSVGLYREGELANGLAAGVARDASGS
jgi:hypothetical protein